MRFHQEKISGCEVPSEVQGVGGGDIRRSGGGGMPSRG